MDKEKIIILLKKVGKKLLILTSIMIAVVLLFIGFIMLSSHFNRKRIKKEVIEKTKQCNLELYITQQPGIEMVNFKDVEIENLKFQILRDESKIKDTLISRVKNQNYNFTSVKIPYTKFLKTDTILLTTKSNLEYKISNFNYGVHSLYGMFGPVAISDCELIERYTINDNLATNTVNKYFGAKIGEDTVKRLSITDDNCKNFIITQSKVYDIIRKLKKSNEDIDITRLIGLEINKDKSYYIVELTDFSQQKSILKIDTETGKVSKELKNYPLKSH